MSDLSKICEHCGAVFVKRARGAKAWAERKYCSRTCAYAARVGRRGDRHPAWRGGRTVDPSGYIRVWMSEDDPFASMRLAHGYVQEHRLIMARHVGRPLRPDETVHHKNGARADNRIENLELRIGRHGRGAALCCADCGSRNIIAVPGG